MNSLLGQNYNQVNPTLDSLDVWYHLNFQKTKTMYDEELIRDKYYSIANSKGSVKLFILKLDKAKIVDEIVINYRHDSREQVEDSQAVRGQTDYHVGTCSTDIFFKRKK